MKQTHAVAAGLAFFALILTGCSARTAAGPAVATHPASVPTSASPAPARPACAPAGPAAGTSPAHRIPASWPERLLLRQSPAELISDEAVDPAAGTVYALISRTTTPMHGPYVLECIIARTGSVRRGASFRVGNLAMVAGYLWVYGSGSPGSPPAVYQAGPVTLARIRPIPLPRGAAGFGRPVFAAGAGHSVWIGYVRTLLRVAAATGAVLTRVTLPPGLAVGNISVDPAQKALYVSAARVVHGGLAGLVVFEYGARSGRRLAAASGGPLRYSVAGAALTAVPGGVWASFRTGMLGLTVHLSRSGLRIIAPPGPGIAHRGAVGLFHWPMYEATSYGGGALWLANQLGIVACLDPRTGAVRASERAAGSASQPIFLLPAVDPARHAIYGFSPRGLVQITPPRRCWR